MSFEAIFSEIFADSEWMMKLIVSDNHYSLTMTLRAELLKTLKRVRKSIIESMISDGGVPMVVYFYLRPELSKELIDPFHELIVTWGKRHGLMIVWNAGNAELIVVNELEIRD